MPEILIQERSGEALRDLFPVESLLIRKTAVIHKEILAALFICRNTITVLFPGLLDKQNGLYLRICMERQIFILDKCFSTLLAEDGNTPSSCTVHIGDIDPATGKPITDMTFFKEYYKMIDHEIYTYWKDRRPTLTPEEKKQREEKKARITISFEQQYGYRPSNPDLQWLTGEYIPERYSASIEWYRDQEGNPEDDRIAELGIPFEDPFGENEPEDIRRLREITSSLNGRLADVYEALLVKYAGGKEKLSMKAIAEKWGVSTAQIYKDKDKIIQMIRESIKTI